MLFVHRNIIRIIWELGIRTYFHLQMNACGQQSGLLMQGCWGGALGSMLQAAGCTGVFTGTQLFFPGSWHRLVEIRNDNTLIYMHVKNCMDRATA